MQTMIPEGCWDFQNAVCTKQTYKAILVEAPEMNDGEEIWIPKSVVDDNSEVYEEDTEGTLIIKEWFAELKGWTK